MMNGPGCVADEGRSLRGVAATLFDVVVLIDDGGRLISASDDLQSRLGYLATEVIGTDALDFLHPDDRDHAAFELLQEASTPDNRSESFTVRFRHGDGSWREMEVTGRLRPDLGGVVVGLRDVTGRRVSDRVLAADAHLFARLPAIASDVTMITDAYGRRVFVSPSVQALLGFAPAEIAAMKRSSLVHADDYQTLRAAIGSVMRAPGLTERVELRVATAAGAYLWFEVSIVNLLDDASVRGVVLHARNIDERRRMEAQLRYRAMHDPLTGLLNRYSFLEHLSSVPGDRSGDDRGDRSSPPTGSGTALLFCDLDEFKQVNDRFGHSAGDDVLLCVGQRLRAAVRPHDLVARIGGDEFCVICRDLPTDDDAVEVAERVRLALAEPMYVRGQSVQIGVSIGICCTFAAPDGEEMLARADRAMYAAKSAGRNRVQVVSIV